jgi:epoxide hydrolase
LLDNIALYWFSNAAASSARLYWESFGTPAPDVVTTPMGASIFPHEIFQAPREWAAERYRDIRMWHEDLDRGGHFAAFEQPELFVAEVREFFDGLDR